MSSEKAMKERLRWACRRGMLELDLFLLPFFEQHYDTLTEHEKTVFAQFLKEPDPSLHAWLMGHDIPLNKEFVLLAQKIKQSRFQP